MSNERLNDANREFEQIEPRFSDDLVRRVTDSFQIRTITPGLKFIGTTAYTSPGSPPQLGPSPITNVFVGGSGGQGDPGTVIYNIINNPPNPTVPNPGTEPPIGPEERIRYSCLSGLCIQDPNGAFLGIDECLQSGCGSGGGGGGGGGTGCDCGFGVSHTVFEAQITGTSAGPLTVSGRTYWQYTWSEVGGARTSTALGSAVNQYEISVDDDGDNSPPATATLARKRIPNGENVAMYISDLGVPWFVQENPLTVVCVSNPTLTIDGGAYVGATP
jgi:hypothetical protein